MNSLKTYLSRSHQKLNEGWKKIPVKRQRQWLLYAFAAYLAVTIAMMAGLFSKSRKAPLRIKHIENPVLKEDKHKHPGISRDSITHRQYTKPN